MHGFEGIGEDWRDQIEAFAEHYATYNQTPQVVWYNAAVDCYGRTPLPEWNEKHANRRTLRLVKVVKP